MPKKKIFGRGDIVTVCLNPTAGQEIQGEHRPVLVLSTASYNILGQALVAPITQGGDFSRFAGFAASLIGSGTKTQGVVLANMVRMIDLEARRGKLVEKAPQFIIDDVIARLQTILD